MATCRSCLAPITWAISVHGRPIPIDAEPVEGGNLVLVDGTHDTDRGAEPVTIARRPDALLEPDLPRYVAHFTTCPNADEHRKR